MEVRRDYNNIDCLRTIFISGKTSYTHYIYVYLYKKCIDHFFKYETFGKLESA